MSIESTDQTPTSDYTPQIQVRVVFPFFLAVLLSILSYRLVIDKYYGTLSFRTGSASPRHGAFL